MEKPKLYKNITNFLSGNSTEKEKRLLDQFFDSYDDEAPEIDPDSKKRIKQDIELNVFREVQKTSKPARKNHLMIYKIAAVLAFVAILSSGILYFLNISGNKKHDIVWFEKVTEYGQKATIDLLDGTRIILNAGSKLKYPSLFTGNTREIFLEGEAFFDVAHDSKNPFIVTAGDIKTVVLGTKFNIKAFPIEKETLVSLIEGKVKVIKEQYNEKQTEILLKPMQQIFFNQENEEQLINSFDLQQATGWKDNVLIFNNISFDKVLNQLERNFGVKFVLNDNTLKSIKIKADFQNESLETIVKSLAKLTRLQYKTEKIINNPMKIIFYRKPNKK